MTKIGERLTALFFSAGGILFGIAGFTHPGHGLGFVSLSLAAVGWYWIFRAGRDDER